MKKPITTLGPIAALVVTFALPAAANAEYLVPPGNSAATQYTEALPTAGGHSDTEKKSGKKEDRTPSKVLGAHSAKQLESQGEAGREAAEFAAETAPVEQASAPQPPPKHSSGRRHHGHAEKEKTGESQEPEASSVGAAGHGDGPGGSSGLGEVVSQAAGSPSGRLGLLLPLALVGTAAWAFAFFRRQRKRPTQ